MHVPDRPPNTPQGETCVRCLREPGHADDIAAFLAGYTWTLREPLPGLVPPFWICASCARVEALEVHASNRTLATDPEAYDAEHPVPT